MTVWPVLFRGGRSWGLMSGIIKSRSNVVSEMESYYPVWTTPCRLPAAAYSAHLRQASVWKLIKVSECVRSFRKFRRRNLSLIPPFTALVIFQKPKSFFLSRVIISSYLLICWMKHFNTPLFTGVTSFPGTAVIGDDNTLMEKVSKWWRLLFSGMWHRLIW
jgi:hypothetical protein